MNTTWQYQIVEGVQSNRTLDILNEHGSQGWELVLTLGPNFVFKRQVLQGEPKKA